MKKNQRGQSIVELVVSLFAFFTVLFLFVQLGISFGLANYIHYATYMAARSYMAGYRDESEQTKAAQAVLDTMLNASSGGRFKGLIEQHSDGPFIGKAQGVVTKIDGSRQSSWEQGVRYKFKARLNMLPIIKSTSGKGNWVDLESQTFLGREPTEADCDTYMATDGPQKKKAQNGFLYDNGC